MQLYKPTNPEPNGEQKRHPVSKAKKHNTRATFPNPKLLQCQPSLTNPPNNHNHGTQQTMVNRIDGA